MVLARLAGHLHAAGFDVAVAHREPLPEQAVADMRGAPAVAWDDLALSKGDLWLVPEGWPNALAPGLDAGARCVVYVQNWAYLFSALPPGVDWRGLPGVRFVSVSDPVARHLKLTLGLDSPILRADVNLELFRAPASKPSLDAGQPLRVAWMPRKNKALARRIREIVDTRLPGGVEWLGIEAIPPRKVARTLASAHVFLATGFPEGCSLPPLEAMACGCLVVGFGGSGGFDYMRQAAEFAWSYRPWWPLRDVEWGGNGLWVADADVLAAALAVEQAAQWWRRGDPLLAKTLAAARVTAEAYSTERLAQAAAALWRQFEQEG